MSWWKNRELLWQFTTRNIELRHKGSHLGLIWSLLNPLLMLGLYVFVFGYIFKGSFRGSGHGTKLEYALGLFLALALFQFVAEVLAIAPSAITSNPSLVKKVVFPLEIIPVANVGASLFHMLITLGLAMLGIAVLGPGLATSALWLPLIVAPVILLALGVSWACAALGVFFRDLMQVISFTTQVLMYASAIFYPASFIPPSGWQVLRFNPMLLAIELSRTAVMWHQPINTNHLAYLWCAGIAACVAGLAVFRRLAPGFADAL